MIGAERIRTLRDVDSVVGLFRELGYPVAKRRIDLAEWQRGGCGALGEGAECDRISRLGASDLLLISGRVCPREVIELARWANARNILFKTICIYYDDFSRQLLIAGPSGRAIRYFAIDLDDPTTESIDRLNLLEIKSARDDPRKLIDRALDRDVVTRQFFRRFREGVESVREVLRERCRRESNENVAGEALLLLSRLLFLSFVQEKGWLDRRRRFLSEESDRSVREGRNYFETVLLPLFFGCLNTPVADRHETAKALGQIPYLNGGLFEPAPFESRNLPFSIPDEVFRRLFDDVFDRYAFRIDETEEGTDIDPQMLGKVFESLMEKDERSASGSFYTPREVVDVLTQRAIIEWLGRNRRERDQVRALLSPESASLAPEDARELIARLASVTIVDPACGSGAFLLSALKVVERIHRELSRTADLPIDRDLRQQIVERSLYGVDIKPEAVRLCELRLWLAIVSQSDATIDNIPPLPNLDRNILQGNTLLTPLDFLGGGRLEIYREWIRGLRSQSELVARYRSGPVDERADVRRKLREADRALAVALLEKSIERDEREIASLSTPAPQLFDDGPPKAPPAAKGSLMQRIGETRAALERVERGELDFFAFDVHFAHVIAARGGFDVVVGNPPWVRAHRVDPQTRRMCGERYRFYGGSRGFDQPDLAIAFVERALGLAAGGGVLSLLLPSKLASSDYASRLRQHLVRETHLVAIDDWSDDAKRLFEADTFPMGITIRKEPPGRGDTDVLSGGERFRILQRELGSGSASSPWSFAPPDVAGLFRRLRREFPPMAEVLRRRPVMGVKTGANRCFFFDRLTLRNGSAQIEGTNLVIPSEALARCVRGRDVRRWRASNSSWLLWPPAGGWSAPPKWVRELGEHFGVATERLKLAYVRPEHLGIKVAWKDLSQGLQAVVLPATSRVGDADFPLVPNQTLYAIDAASMDEAFLLSALLNSTVVNALALAVADRAKDAHFRYFGATIAAIPLPVLARDSSESIDLVRLARRAHRGEDVDGLIDRIVNDVYRLSRTEVKRLQSYVGGRLTVQ